MCWPTCGRQGVVPQVHPNRPETPLERTDRMSREHFRVAAVGIFIETQTLEVLRAVVGGGEEQWFRTAGRIYDRHKFQRTDYDWMFKQIRKAVKKYDRQRTHG